MSTNTSITATPVVPDSWRRGRAATIGLWTASIALAVPVGFGGVAKLTGDPQMVDMFTTIGAGQGLRVLIGILEIAGALGLLLPLAAGRLGRMARPLAGLAAFGLALLLIGAAVTNVAVLGTSPALPLVLLALAAAVVTIRRRELRAMITR
ncbi:DoxX family protein [Kribbella sp. NPDC049227]|uniref:DoxX family protein n=1 Tax=Kribbella sp. NPDC049227 TaxID=3364113 RepID=UPI00371F1D12